MPTSHDLRPLAQQVAPLLDLSLRALALVVQAAHPLLLVLFARGAAAVVKLVATAVLVVVQHLSHRCLHRLHHHGPAHHLLQHRQLRLLRLQPSRQPLQRQLARAQQRQLWRLDHRLCKLVWQRPMPPQFYLRCKRSQVVRCSSCSSSHLRLTCLLPLLLQLLMQTQMQTQMPMQTQMRTVNQCSRLPSRQ